MRTLDFGSVIFIFFWLEKIVDPDVEETVQSWEIYRDSALRLQENYFKSFYIKKAITF